jgi:hypothetical protein
MSALPENVPTVTVELDRPRTLAFTLGAMRRIKEATGRSISEIQETDIQPETFGSYIWALLVNEDRAGLTVEDIEEMVHAGNLRAVSAALQELVGGLAEGNASTETPNPPNRQARRRSTGTRSGRGGASS